MLIKNLKYLRLDTKLEIEIAHCWIAYLCFMIIMTQLKYLKAGKLCAGVIGSTYM